MALSENSETKTVKAGEWIIVEGDIPAYFLYKLKKGKVAIYEEREKITSVEVKEGEKPHFLGFMSTLSEDRRHRASVKTETEVELEIFSSEHIRGLLLHDVPPEMRQDMDSMIETIQLGDRIKGLKRLLAEKPLVDLKIEADMDPELSEIMQEFKALYLSIMNDPECRDQA